MKKIFNFMLVLGGMLVLAASCNKILEEHPKTIFTPGYFSTPAGVEGGLTALYSHLRDVYGDPYTWSDLEAATDETTFSNSGFRGNDFSTGAHVTADNCPKSGFWNFTYINTANGIIENATAAGMAESLIAEARFFRAFYYFDLVRIFGGVPLDLGSGELAFNTSAVRVSTRNTVEEVYKKCIFPDLEYALENIPDKPRIGGALSKTAVRILLSRAYLTYAWWLENPKGLPTYPECTRNAGDARNYFQKAYDLAVQGIENPGPYGLESSFYKVSLGSNDYNKEQVFYSDRTEKSEQYKKIFGISGRDYSPSEKKYAEAWADMGFEDEAVSRAFDITVLNTGKLAWKYMDTILRNWHAKGLHTAAEIEAAEPSRKVTRPPQQGGSYTALTPQEREKLKNRHRRQEE
jgi:DnaD/phage-associated family protein